MVGAEFPEFAREQEKWIILQFEYDSIQYPNTDWNFPWSFTIRSKTESDLELIVYVIYVGYHNWIGHVTEMDFDLKGGETKVVSGGDTLPAEIVDQIAYIREIVIDIYIAER